MLIVRGQHRAFAERQAVIRLDEALGAVGQRAVAEERADTALLQICAVRRRQKVHRCGHAKRVGGTLPGRASQGESRRDRAVDLRERIGFCLAVRAHGASEESEFAGHLVLDVGAEAQLALFTAAHGVQVGYATGTRCGSQCIVIACHDGARAEREQAHDTALGACFIGALEFELVTVVASQSSVELQLVRLAGFRKATRAHGPAVVQVLDCHAACVPAGVGRVVVRTVGHQHPVHELIARVMGQGVGVEEVEHRQRAGRDDHTAAVVRGGELVLSALDRG